MTESAAPLSFKVFSYFREKILSGDLPADAQLPSIRDQMKLFGVSRNTVLAANKMLADENFIVSSERKRAKVSRLTSAQSRLNYFLQTPSIYAPSSPLKKSALKENLEVINLSEILVGDWDQGEITADIIEGLAGLHVRSPKLTASFMHPLGLTSLREHIAKYLKHEGIHVDTDEVLILRDKTHAIRLLSDLLIKPDTHLYIQEGSWTNATKPGFRNTPFRTVLPNDKHGLDIRKAQISAARKVFLFESFRGLANGMTTDSVRRREISDYCRRNEIPVMEDTTNAMLATPAEREPSVSALLGKDLGIYLGGCANYIHPLLGMCWVATSKTVIDRLSTLASIALTPAPLATQLIWLELFEQRKVKPLFARIRKQFDQMEQIGRNLITEILGDKVEILPNSAPGMVRIRIKKAANLEAAARRVGITYLTDRDFGEAANGEVLLISCLISQTVLEAGLYRLNEALLQG